MGSSTPQGREALALSHLALLRSGLQDAVRSLIRRFRSSIPSPHMPLSNASSAASRPPSHGLGTDWFAIPYLSDFFHHCFMPVYPDAIPPGLLATQVSPAAAALKGPQDSRDFYARANHASLPMRASGMLAA